MKADLYFSSPWMNAAGSLGFALDRRQPFDLSWLGAFVTNPISLKARSPARDRLLLDFPGGFLLHTGWPNPGLSQAIRLYAARWARSPVPVIVHLLAGTPDELETMARRLETVEGVMGIEVGLPLECQAEMARALLAAAQGELPVIARLPFERSVQLAGNLSGSPIAALSLGPPRGALPGPQGGLVHGRLYGPALFPTALNLVNELAQMGVKVIAAGGVYGPGEAQAMLSAGALAVQFDAALWLRPVNSAELGVESSAAESAVGDSAFE
jgi:dihydroorotate dehydrogenase (NAD+) catalytic subunit